MSWLGLVVVVVGIYLAFKVAGTMFQLVLWSVVLLAGYWFSAPVLGWPTLEQLLL